MNGVTPLEWGMFWLQVAEHPNDMQGRTCLTVCQWNYSKELFPEAKSMPDLDNHTKYG
jgi:hypothetical protein